MSTENDFYELVPGFTSDFAEKKLKFAIAAGKSASDFAILVEESASSQNLQIPTIFRLSREESKLMYFDLGYNPIAVISRIITSAAIGNIDTVLNVNFLEDYSMYGAKSSSMDKRLSCTPYGNSYSFTYHIMVAAREIRRPNVSVYRVDSSIATSRDLTYNPR